LAWAPDGSVLASGGDDGVVGVWDAGTGALVRELTGHTGPVNTLAWAPNGAWLAAGTGYGTIVLWPSGEPSEEPAVELVPLADGGWAALGNGWHKISGRVSGEFWYAINMCRFEPGVLGTDREGSRPLALDAPLPVLRDQRSAPR
jgi:WD domain, G-beta repeat